MATAIKNGLTLKFDGLHGITGPYATDIFCRLLGAPTDSVLNATPLPDFGGGHPDPNPVDVPGLYNLALSDQSPALLAASDGDGDRNMILVPGQMVSPGDSLAIMLANATLIPGYKRGMRGVARSMPTSTAVDRVAKALNIPCYETPTGWKFFCNLLDSGDIDLCGEESFGTGSSHVREKDGLWAVLFWLNLLAARQQAGDEILREHWQTYGRDYYQRYDYFIADSDQAEALFTALKQNAENSTTRIGERNVTLLDNFTYHDPVDQSVSRNQGIRLRFGEDSRIIYRLSGTGTSGATLRVYLQQQETDPNKHGLDPKDVLRPLGELAAHYARIEHFTGLQAPTAII
jgi:phosphoglucomutase